MFSIIIADDHPLICDGLKSILSHNGKWDIVNVFHSGEEALDFIKNGFIGLAILDIEMGTISGLEIAKYIKANKLDVKVIILTLYKDKFFLLEALDYGVFGYLNKDAVSEELKMCVENVMANKRYIGKSAIEDNEALPSYIEDLVQWKMTYQKLSQSEKNIVQLIREGFTSNEIAKQLFISRKTVENHRGNICKKLNLKGQNSLTKWTYEYRSMLKFEV